MKTYCPFTCSQKSSRSPILSIYVFTKVFGVIYPVHLRVHKNLRGHLSCPFTCSQTSSGSPNLSIYVFTNVFGVIYPVHLRVHKCLGGHLTCPFTCSQKSSGSSILSSYVFTNVFGVTYPVSYKPTSQPSWLQRSRKRSAMSVRLHVRGHRLDSSSNPAINTTHILAKYFSCHSSIVSSNKVKSIVPFQWIAF